MTCFIVGIISFPFSLSGIADYIQYLPANIEPALCAAVGFSEITSANVVGYNSVEINKQYTILSVNFAKVDNDNMTVNEVLPYSAGMNKGNSSTGDQIQIPDPITGLYTSYYLSDGNFSGRTGTVYYPERDGKWFKGTATTPATDVMKPGTTFWYISTKFDTAYPITVAGAVATDATKSFEINKTYTLIANPYPTALKLNGVAGETFVGRQDGMKSGNSSSGDQIQIPDPITGLYASYYLSDGNFSGRTGTVYYPERDGKWFKGTATTETTDSIPAGMGGWYIRMGTATFDITVENPVK